MPGGWLSLLGAACSGAAQPANAHETSRDAGSFVVHVSEAGTASQPSLGPCDSTYRAVARLIFEGDGCANAVCHAVGPDAPAAGLNLSESKAYRELVGVRAKAAVPAGWQRVTPGDEQTSFLYLKLWAAEPAGVVLPIDTGAPMPLKLPPLTAEHLSALVAWIRGGAAETDVTPGTEMFVEQCQNSAR